VDAAPGDTFSYGDARKTGASDKRLYRLRDSGEIVALGGGIYRWADAPQSDNDLIEITERVPLATLCQETALARHRLTDAIPAAIPRAEPFPAPRTRSLAVTTPTRATAAGRAYLDLCRKVRAGPAARSMS
jgi:hypothetical protein